MLQVSVGYCKYYEKPLRPTDIRHSTSHAITYSCIIIIFRRIGTYPCPSDAALLSAAPCLGARLSRSVLKARWFKKLATGRANHRLPPISNQQR